jgi:hypothetical protein
MLRCDLLDLFRRKERKELQEGAILDKDETILEDRAKDFKAVVDHSTKRLMGLCKETPARVICITF